MTTVSRSLALAAAIALCLGGAGNAFARQSAGAPAHPGVHATDKDHVQVEKDRGAAGRDVRIRKEVVERPVLGVLLAPDEKAGVRIAGVTPDGGAAKAGLRSGDRLVSVDGKPVQGGSAQSRIDDARRLLGDLSVKSAVKIGYERAGRAATASVTPQLDRHVMIWKIDDGASATGNGHVVVKSGQGGTFELLTDDIVGDAPGIHEEILRLAPRAECKGGACKAPMLMSAFRWNGLNLASVDAQLGRYFGTDHGVLVLSTGELAGLQAGDVLQRVGGKPVASPREVMAALRGKPDGARVPVDYLRDRKAGKTSITVPKLMQVPFPPPPAPPVAPPPPAPPAPPKSAMRVVAPGHGLVAALAPPPPAPPVAPMPPLSPGEVG